MNRPGMSGRWTVAVVGCVCLFLAGRGLGAPPEGQPAAGQAGYRRFTLTYRGGDGADRERTALVWYPTPAEAQKFNYQGQIGFVAPDAEVVAAKCPLIVFSHGFLGKADQTIFLMEAWAQRGYIVAALDHADAITQKKRKWEAPRFADPQGWSDQKFADRREDMRALLDHLLAENERQDSYLCGRVDPDAIGAAGHSLGGYTVLGLVGGWESWRDERLRAALLMSPYVTPYIEHERLKAVKTPVMLQGGTLDFGITPFLPKVFERLAAPKYYLVLKNETHFGWTNLVSLGKTTTECAQAGNPQLMTDYSLAFFDRHLRGRESELLQEENERLESYDREAE